jgi:hypothetical protein
MIRIHEKNYRIQRIQGCQGIQESYGIPRNKVMVNEGEGERVFLFLYRV